MRIFNFFRKNKPVLNFNDWKAVVALANLSYIQIKQLPKDEFKDFLNNAGERKEDLLRGMELFDSLHLGEN